MTSARMPQYASQYRRSVVRQMARPSGAYASRAGRQMARRAGRRYTAKEAAEDDDDMEATMDEMYGTGYGQYGYAYGPSPM